MKFTKFIHLVAIIAALLPALALAQQYRPPVADSTGIRPGVTATISTGLTVNDVSNIAGGIATTIVTNAGNTTSTIPPGYREIVTTMGNRAISAVELGYYAALNYPVTSIPLAYSVGSDPGVALCTGYSGQGKLVAYSVVVAPASESSNEVTEGRQVVCEPMGTRSTLQKIVGADVVTVTRAQLDAYLIAPAIGVNTGTAAPICQLRGYTNFVPGSIVSTGGPGCGTNLITQYRTSYFVNDDACYNQVLQTMQCWR